jgi:hypothetical protein
VVQGDGGVPDHQVPHTPGSLRRPCLGLQLRSSQKGIARKQIFSFADFINLTAVLSEFESVFATFLRKLVNYTASQIFPSCPSSLTYPSYCILPTLPPFPNLASFSNLALFPILSPSHTPVPLYILSPFPFLPHFAILAISLICFPFRLHLPFLP